MFQWLQFSLEAYYGVSIQWEGSTQELALLMT